MRRLRFALVTSVVITVAAVGVVVSRNHRTYAEWALFPSATPPRLPVNGRDYDREEPVASVPAGSVVLDHTPAGVTVLGPPGPFPPTVIEVRTKAGLTSYSLSGSP